MATSISTHSGTGETWSLFPANQSLTDWTTYRVAQSESGAPDLGQYTGSVDETIGAVWHHFPTGASAPSNWGESQFISTIESDVRTASSPEPVKRTLDDTKPITFEWLVSGATISGTRRIDGGAEVAVSGAIAFDETKDGRHYYTLAHNVADRPTAEGVARYRFVDLGLNVRTITLRVEPASAGAELDTAIPELTVAQPSATPTIRTGLMLLYMMVRNRLVSQTSGTDALEVYNDAGTLIAKKEFVDDGSDYTENKMESG